MMPAKDRPGREEMNQQIDRRQPPLIRERDEMSEAELEEVMGGTPAGSMYAKILQAQNETKKGIIANFRV